MPCKKASLLPSEIDERSKISLIIFDSDDSSEVSGTGGVSAG